MAMSTSDYFLEIPGITGGSTDEQHEGAFDVLGYQFDLTALMGSGSGGGASVGKTTISPFIVDLASTPGLADLLDKLANGEHIPEVTFTARTRGGNPFEYQTITLSNVTVVGYQEKSGFATRVALGFDAIEVEVTDQSVNGGPAPTRTFTWDLTESGGALEPLPAGALDPVVTVPTTPDYFLAVDGVTGGATAEGHEGAFDILGYEFDLTGMLAASSGGGGATGKPVFSPLIVDFALAPGLVDLLQKIATGQHIPEATFTVQKPGADPFTYQTIKLSDVTVLGFEEKADFATRVAFGYRAIEVTVNEQRPDGSVGTAHVFAFDVAAGGSLAPVGELAPEITSDVAADYFLDVPGINGGATTSGHAGDFNVLSYAFDLAATMAASGGGGSAGKTTISPLILDLAATPGLADLLDKAAKGEHIETVTFTVRKAGDPPSDFQVVTLSDVTVLGYEEKAGFATRVALGFGAIEVEVKEQRPDGSLGTSRIFAWDVPAGSMVAPAGLEPEVATPPLSYFITVDGIAGDATAQGHEGSFDVLSYAFDLTAALGNIGGGGGTVGKTLFSPLIVDFALAPALVELLEKAAAGQHIPDATFTVQKPGEDPFTYQTIKLSDVVILGFEEKADFATRVAFGYSELEITVNEQRPDGSAGTAHVFTFDVTELSPLGALEPEVAFDVAAEYFLAIAGVDGGSTDSRHQGAFDVLSYEFDLAAFTSASSGGGGATGKTTLSPLILDFGTTPELVQLLQKAATGEIIPSVTFTARKPGENPFEYQTITLTDVKVLGYEEKAGFATRVALGYGAIEVKATEQNPNGSRGETHSFAYDLDASGALAPLAPGALDPKVEVVQATEFFLKLDGILGSSADEEHQNEFDVVGYEFDLLTTPGTGSGGGSGKTTFSPLVIELEPSSGLVALLDKIASGEHIPSATFTASKPGTNFDYQTIKLTDVTIVGYEEQANQPTRVLLHYRAVEVEAIEQNPDGSPGETHVFEWNTDENHAPVITTPPTETSADITNGAYAVAGQVAFTDPDGDTAIASAQLFDLIPVDTTLPEDALALLRPLLESAFQIVPTTGAWQFNLPQDAAKLLAANEVLEIVYRVTVSDGVASVASALEVGAATTQDIAISIQGVNDAPTINQIATQQVHELPDSTGLSTLDQAEIQATFSDPDLNDVGHTGTVLSVAASGATAGLALNNAALLSFLTPGAVEKPPGTSLGTANYAFAAPDKSFDYLKSGQKLLLTYTIAIDDGDGGHTTQIAAIEIIGANDAPIINSPTLFTLQENTTAVGNVVATDIEGENLTFGIAGGDDQSLFAVDPTTGALRFLTSPDYETREDRNGDNVYSVVVSATDASGGVSTQTVGVKVTNVSEAGKIVNGGNGSDSLNGGTGGDLILAGNGNDTVNAGDGDDLVHGGNGSDSLFGGRGMDGMYGDEGNDLLDGGLGSDLLFGGNGKDILKGGGDNDLLYGGNGDDILDGGSGDDILAGDNGNDRFVFGPNSGNDVIADFRRGDIIEFQGGVFDNFQEVRAASRQILGSTVIDIGDDTIVLIGVQLRDLRASDFLFT
jgi:VCBS repeat-containing protein